MVKRGHIAIFAGEGQNITVELYWYTSCLEYSFTITNQVKDTVNRLKLLLCVRVMAKDDGEPRIPRETALPWHHPHHTLQHLQTSPQGQTATATATCLISLPLYQHQWVSKSNKLMECTED